MKRYFFCPKRKPYLPLRSLTLTKTTVLAPLHRFTGLLLALLAAVFFIPFLGNAHLFDWDEINFAEIAREMVATGNWSEPQIGFTAFTEKPPLFFWLQALSMKCFGVNEFAARLPNALLGMLVLPFLFYLGKRFKDHRFGLLWALAYFGSLLPNLYFKSGIIDPYFNFFIFAGLVALFKAEQNRKQQNPVWSWILASGIFTGLAILTKGPVGLLIPGLVILVLTLLRRFQFPLPLLHLVAWGIITLLTTGTWFAYNYFQNGPAFIEEFTLRQWALLTTPDAGQKGFFLYHVVILFFGCFPGSTFLIHGWRYKGVQNETQASFIRWMKVLFAVVLVLFSLVTTKIVHYSSLTYYPLSFLAAWSLYGLLYEAAPTPRWMKFSLGFSALPFVLFPLVATWGGLNMEQVKPLFKKDPFVSGNLEAVVHWTGWEFIPGLLLLLVLGFFFARLSSWRGGTRYLLLFLGTAIYLQTVFYFLLNKIEAISQRAHIEFWESLQDKDAYYMSYGFKTYTFYFYGKMKPPSDPRYHDRQWLIKGELDKPLYFSSKIQSIRYLPEEMPDAEFLYQKNGFYFFRRPSQAEKSK